MLPETREFIDSFENIIKLKGRAKHTEWFTSFENDDVDISNDKKPIHIWAQENEFGGAFVGIRADESSKRKKLIRKYGDTLYVTRRKQWACYPLAYFTVDDIWSYIYHYGLKYNNAYDRLSELGVEKKYQRIGPLAVESVLQFGQLSILKNGWPELFNKFAEKYKDAKRYI
jgi:predicted phosphoadenosine phosphosulfate sulfurtransferase